MKPFFLIQDKTPNLSEHFPIAKSKLNSEMHLKLKIRLEPIWNQAKFESKNSIEHAVKNPGTEFLSFANPQSSRDKLRDILPN